LAETFTTYYHSPVGQLKIAGTADYISEVSFHDVTQKSEGKKKHLPPLIIQCIEPGRHCFSKRGLE
jgi:methylated-DNA-[protein]-cysteine S-methyltransferase